MHIQGVDAKIISRQVQTFKHTLQSQELAVTMDHLVLDRIEKKKETAVSDR
jgi:hypothetical protein